ncbi:unnamed protein product [Paramecium octaurelia]|uniref:Tetratricopeptide repeat protein n=1 Tax=Paramecium octaurelia TaxID=43137 RepID=A0A8S1WZC7_PAROT|nr:unnamed protein product [Paramecium octaurelia]
MNKYKRNLNFKEVREKRNEMKIQKNKQTIINYHLKKNINKLEQTNPNFISAVQKNLEDSDQYFNKATSLIKINMLEEALENYDLAILKNPKVSDYYNKKAIVLDKMNRLQEALENYDTAIQKNPEDSDYYNNKDQRMH